MLHAASTAVSVTLLGENLHHSAIRRIIKWDRAYRMPPQAPILRYLPKIGLGQPKEGLWERAVEMEKARCRGRRASVPR